jgi:hypothetical protein
MDKQTEEKKEHVDLIIYMKSGNVINVDKVHSFVEISGGVGGVKEISRFKQDHISTENFLLLTALDISQIEAIVMKGKPYAA